MAGDSLLRGHFLALASLLADAELGQTFIDETSGGDWKKNVRVFCLPRVCCHSLASRSTIGTASSPVRCSRRRPVFTSLQAMLLTCQRVSMYQPC